MNRSIGRISLLAAAVATGAFAFGLFWSAKVHGFSTTGGPYCNANGNAPMCYMMKTTLPSVPPNSQSTYLNAKTATCGACGSSPN